MIIIEKALGKHNIDEVVTLSREVREQEGCKSKSNEYCDVADGYQQALSM